MAEVYQVPVMVTISVHGIPPNVPPDWAPDSGQVAEVVHERVSDWLPAQDEGFVFLSVDGVSSDPDDPNSPPVPASQVDGS